MQYYHVRITQKSRRYYDEVKLDLNLEELNIRVLTNYRSGQAMVINGKVIEPEDVERIRISQTEELSDNYRSEAAQIRQTQWANVIPAPSLDWIIADKGEDVTDDFILGPPGWKVESSGMHIVTPRPSSGTRKVFVVHGRDTFARDELFKYLRAIDLHPIEWSEAVQMTGKSNPHIWDILTKAFSEAHAILVLLTPDDETRLREELHSKGEQAHEIELYGQARPNVLFEAGMAMGRSEDRTILVELGVLRPFSDIAGRHTVRLDNSPQRRQELAQRLRAAGCPVNLEGTDWYKAGDFEPSL